MGKRLLFPALLLAIGLALGFFWGRGSAPAPGKDAATAAGGSAAATPGQKMASVFPGTLTIREEDAVLFAEEVTRATEGRVAVRHFDPGKLVPALEIFDAVSKGSVDAGWGASGFWAGKIPATSLFTAVPFGPDIGEYKGWMFEGGGLEIWQDLYAQHNVHVEPRSMTPPEASGWFREPIRSVEQFRGKKLRYFGLGGQVVQKFGASVQLLAAGEIFPALERGVLDGLEFSLRVMDQRMGFCRIAKHYYSPGWHQPTSFGELLVNMARWNEISEGDRLIVRMACRANMVRNLAKEETLESAAMEAFRQEGVTPHYWDAPILEDLSRKTAEVMAEESANDADFARTWNSLKSYRQTHQEWARLSRLPPGFGR